MIFRDLQPYSFVEDIGKIYIYVFKLYENLVLYKRLFKGFLMLLKSIAPKYEVPGRKFFTSDIDKVYHEKVEILRAKLRNANHVALTADLWTDPHNMADITITCHTIIDFKLYDLVLSTRTIYLAHTGENLNSLFTVNYILFLNKNF